jgi:hypothetical protein
MNELLKHDKAKNAFTYQGKPLTGLLSLLSLTFYPTYTWERATLGPSMQDGKMPPTETRFAKRGNKGIERGTLVDREVSEMVRLMRKYSLEANHWFFIDKTQLPDNVQKSSVALHEIIDFKLGMHDYTKNLLKYLIKYELEPEDSQVVVMHEALRIGTAVDLLCFKKKTPTKKVIIEIKCGFSNYYDKHTTYMMNEPFSHLNDSPHWQHQLQVAFTRLLYCMTYNKREKDVSAAVVRLYYNGHKKENAVKVFPLDEKIIKLLPEAQVAIANERNLAATIKNSNKKRKIVNVVK